MKQSFVPCKKSPRTTLGQDQTVMYFFGGDLLMQLRVQSYEVIFFVEWNWEILFNDKLFLRLGNLNKISKYFWF